MRRGICAGARATPACQSACDHHATIGIYSNHLSPENTGHRRAGRGRRQIGKRKRIRRQNPAANAADVDRIAGVGIEGAKAGAIVVGQGPIGGLSALAVAEELSWRRRKREHDGGPDGGMVESEPVADLVNEQRFQIQLGKS